MILIIVVPIIFFIVILLLKPRCPKCGSPTFDIDVNNGRIVHICNYCGEEWI